MHVFVMSCSPVYSRVGIDLFPSGTFLITIGHGEIVLRLKTPSLSVLLANCALLWEKEQF